MGLGIPLLKKSHEYSSTYVLYIAALLIMGFPGSSAGKESTCNAGDPSSIPGSGR